MNYSVGGDFVAVVGLILGGVDWLLICLFVSLCFAFFRKKKEIKKVTSMVQNASERRI